MFEKYVGMKFDKVVKMLSQLKGLVEIDDEYNSILYTDSPFGWCSADTYEFYLKMIFVLVMKLTLMRKIKGQ